MTWEDIWEILLGVLAYALGALWHVLRAAFMVASCFSLAALLVGEFKLAGLLLLAAIAALSAWWLVTFADEAYARWLVRD